MCMLTCKQISWRWYNDATHVENDSFSGMFVSIVQIRRGGKRLHSPFLDVH